MRCRKPTQRGGALVELALIMPLLSMLTLITTEFGRAMYEYHVLVKTTRDAVRYLSVQTPGSGVDAARNLMVYGNTAGTGTPLAIGLSLANVPAASCCTWQNAGSAPVINTVTVRISGYVFRPMVSSAFGQPLGDANGGIPYGEISASMRAPL